MGISIFTAKEKVKISQRLKEVGYGGDGVMDSFTAKEP